VINTLFWFSVMCFCDKTHLWFSVMCFFYKNTLLVKCDVFLRREIFFISVERVSVMESRSLSNDIADSL
jgi:hypothetical protein